MLYVYAITDSPRTPVLAGLDGAALRAIGEDGLFAIVSDHEHAPTQASANELWIHESVVEDAMADATVLPARLGSTLPDDAAVRDLLRARRDELERALDRVRGAVELGVRAAVPSAAREPKAPAADSERAGTAYMQARLDRERRSARTVAQIHEPLAALARADTSRLVTRDRPTLNAAYLVDRERMDEFMARLEDVKANSEAAIVCTGPWPPYSFSSVEPSE